jgi:FAD-dependent urate hydroxylase
MPVGMNLKSEPYASDIAAPEAGYDVAAYCRLHDVPYVDRIGPLSLERFVDYAEWYIKELVPDISDATVTQVSTAADGFGVSFAESESRIARTVVVATGTLPYASIPGELAGLPADLVSHSSDHHQLGQFRGRTVAIVGAGQSALETAALLHESGADTKLLARRPAIQWLDRNPEQLGHLGHVRRPTTKLCEGWHCAVWNSPDAFRLLPRDTRVAKAKTVLGPAGAWWLRERVEGKLEVLTASRIREAVPRGSGLRLLFDDERRSSLDVDHVVAGTGFRVDVARLGFLPQSLLARIETLSRYPVLTRSCESTVPGLYFVGAHAAVSLGPSERFLAGTHNCVRQLSRSVIRRLAVARPDAPGRRITTAP